MSLQELQLHCTEGQALLNTLLVSRELVIPWGPPQIEDRALETLQQEWRLYQARLADTRAQLNSALAKLRQMEQKFQRLDSWLKGMETKAQLRSHRRSDRTTKDAQLQLIKVRVTCREALHGKMFCTLTCILCALNIPFLFRAGRRKCWCTRRRWRVSVSWLSRFWMRLTSAAGSAPEPPRLQPATTCCFCIYW